jgi:hypothetical protein
LSHSFSPESLFIDGVRPGMPSFAHGPTPSGDRAAVEPRLRFLAQSSPYSLLAVGLAPPGGF